MTYTQGIIYQYNIHHCIHIRFVRQVSRIHNFETLRKNGGLRTVCSFVFENKLRENHRSRKHVVVIVGNYKVAVASCRYMYYGYIVLICT